MEKEKIGWYDKVQKPIRIIAIILTAYFIYILINEKSDILLFKENVNLIDDALHGYELGNILWHVMRYARITSIVLLGLAFVVLVEAEFYQSIKHDIWYKCQTMGIGLCAFTGLLYPLSILILGNSKFALEMYSFNIVPIYFCLVAFAGVIFICNILYYRGKKELHIETGKTTKNITYYIVALTFLGANIYFIANIWGKCIEVRELQKIIDAQPKGYVEDIGYQMGNYSSQESYYDGEKLYFVQGEAVYMIDESGECSLFWKTDEPIRRLWNIAVHNGYLYANYMPKGVSENKVQLIRINMSDKSMEMILGGEHILHYGIVGDRLYYYNRKSSDASERQEIYYLDLNKELSQENAVLYDKGISDPSMCYDGWLGRYMYNQSEDFYYSGGSGDLQCYQGKQYDIVTQNYKGHSRLNGYLKNKSDDFILEYEVYEFNIFNGRIYYIIKGEHFELWSCDMLGNDKHLIGEFYQSMIEGEYDGEFARLYMTEDYAVLDIGIYYGDYNAHLRKLMWLEDGTTQDVELK